MELVAVVVSQGRAQPRLLSGRRSADRLVRGRPPHTGRFDGPLLYTRSAFRVSIPPSFVIRHRTKNLDSVQLGVSTIGGNCAAYSSKARAALRADGCRRHKI